MKDEYFYKNLLIVGMSLLLHFSPPPPSLSPFLSGDFNAR